MKKHPLGFFPAKSKAIARLCSSLLVMAASAWGAELKEARVTAVIKDVNLLPGQAAPRPAAVNDAVRRGDVVRTGVDSRSELTFTDLTLARLGSNTIFSFDQASRTIDLSSGAILLRVPKGSGGAQIKSAAVSAAITGTTVMVEHSPKKMFKFIVLEGSAQLTLNGSGDSVVVNAGECSVTQLDPPPTQLGRPVEIDIGRLMETSQLIQDFPPLESLSLIKKEIQAQDAATANASNAVQPVATLTDLTDVVSQRFAAEPGLTPSPSPRPSPTPSPSPSPSPTPSPAKFGALEAIASSNLSVIDTGTVIQTDPTITRNGETGFGKIYRGPAQDGAPSTYFFGATSAFDVSSGFDTHFSDSANSPIASFKFQSLQLAGDPTISTASNGPPNLALISVGALTSGPPGGILTFAGIQQLLLATQNGSITLGSNLSFFGIPALYVYARGATSDLTVDAAFLGAGDLSLQAERNLLATNSLSIVQASSDQQAGLNISLTAGEELKIGGDLAVIAVASGMQTGGNLVIASGENMTIGGAFDLLVFAAPESTVGTAGNITVRSGGSLNAGSLNFFLGNLTGGTGGETLLLDVAGDLKTTTGGMDLILVNAPSVSTNGGGNIASATINVSVGGDLVTQSAAVINILNTGFDVSGGGTIGADASIDITANNVSTGAGLDVEIFNNAASQIGGNAVINLAAAGDINVQGDAFFDILNTAEPGNDVVIDGGAIGENATVSFSARDVQTQGVFEIGILNNDFRFLNGAGQIGGNANLTFRANDLSSAGYFNLVINNAQGLIGGDSGIDARAASISTDNILFAHIFNDGGGIGQNAAVSVVTTGAISAGSDAIFEISNPGGTIGGNATLDVNAASITTGGKLFASIDNTGGSIGGNAAINVSVSNNVAVTGDATLQILGSDGAVGAAININGASYDAGGTFLASIDGNGAITFNDASIHADVLKVEALGPNGVLNIGGGTLSADTTLNLFAGGSNGSINFTADVTLSSQSTAAVIAANTVTIVNGALVTIGGKIPASVFTNVPNYTGSGGNGTTTGMFGGSGAVTNPFGGFASPGQLKANKGNVLVPGGPKTKKNVEIPGAMSDPARTVTRNTPGTNRRAMAGAINLESSSQLLDLLDGAAPPTKKGKVMVDARRMPKADSGKGHANADRGTVKVTGSTRGAEDVKPSHDRLDSIRRRDASVEKTFQSRSGELPSSLSRAPAVALR